MRPAQHRGQRPTEYAREFKAWYEQSGATLQAIYWKSGRHPTWWLMVLKVLELSPEQQAHLDLLAEDIDDAVKMMHQAGIKF